MTRPHVVSDCGLIAHAFGDTTTLNWYVDSPVTSVIVPSLLAVNEYTEAVVSVCGTTLWFTMDSPLPSFTSSTPLVMCPAPSAINDPAMMIGTPSLYPLNIRA